MLKNRVVVFAGLALVALLILGLVSGPIGQSLFGKNLIPLHYLPPKPLSGVKIEEGTVPGGLTAISFDEVVAKAKDGNLVLITEEGEQLAITVKGDQNASLSSTFTGKNLEQTLIDDGVRVKEASPLAAGKLFHVFGDFYITNTMVATWFTILVLGLLFWFATRKMKDVPTGLQNFVEAMIEVMLNFVQGVAGKEKGRKFFPIVASIFLFVIGNAWLSLLPIFNSVTYNGVALFRGANTDINVPLAIALFSFIVVEYWGISFLGFKVYMKKFIRLSSLRQGKIFVGLVEAFVGALEAISEFIRVLSFTFRLFGNMTAGEILLLVSAFLVPFVFSTVFYGLELFIGLVQALIFAGLTLVFATTAVAGHGEEEGHAESHAEAKS